MSSTNDHLLPHPKSKMSPLEFRNTDLVSRLLAATPPYLYNMSLLPNTYFFSEMLRSLVQAKNEQHRLNNMHPPMRRSRKRTWSQQRNDLPINEITKTETPEPWMLKSNKQIAEERENPLELTTNTLHNKEAQQTVTKIETSSHDVDNIDFQNVPQNVEPPGMVLPPPPPMWYPPIYPTPPYGIDPLHFFIDLRVSGHIYDRKNQQKDLVAPNSSVISPRRDEQLNNSEELLENKNKETTSCKLSGNYFLRQRGHCSAFSVPNNNKSPMNLINNETKTKFDVKSLGFDKSNNKISANYIMKNVVDIYKNIDRQKNADERNAEEDNDTEQKRVKDLKALFGLELVVDYMKHKKSNPNIENTESNTSEVELVGSPTLEVVALQEEN